MSSLRMNAIFIEWKILWAWGPINKVRSNFNGQGKSFSLLFFNPCQFFDNNFEFSETFPFTLILNLNNGSEFSCPCDKKESLINFLGFWMIYRFNLFSDVFRCQFCFLNLLLRRYNAAMYEWAINIGFLWMTVILDWIIDYWGLYGNCVVEKGGEFMELLVKHTKNNS
jgi:hypothetical protein